MIRRDRQAPPFNPRRQRSGVVQRGALRRVRHADPRRDWLGGVIVAVMAGIVLVALSGAFNGAPDRSSSAAVAATPSGPAPPSASTPAVSARPTSSPIPTRPPTPSPTPTRPPTPSPPPTPRPTPTATPRPTSTRAPTQPPLTGGLVILEPADGAIVFDELIVVRGLAPPGVTITRDIPLWFDEHSVAGATGGWSFAVKLEAGENTLKFRLGDDIGTTRTLTVVLQSAP